MIQSASQEETSVYSLDVNYPHMHVNKDSSNRNDCLVDIPLPSKWTFLLISDILTLIVSINACSIPYVLIGTLQINQIAGPVGYC